MLSSGRIELCFRPSGSACIKPAKRYLTVQSTPGKWLKSSSVRYSSGGRSYDLGQIRARRVTSGAYPYIEMSFLPDGAAASNAILPDPWRTFFYASSQTKPNAWYWSSSITVNAARSSAGAVGPDPEAAFMDAADELSPADPNTPDPPDAVGGPLSTLNPRGG